MVFPIPPDRNQFPQAAEPQSKDQEAKRLERMRPRIPEMKNPRDGLALFAFNKGLASLASAAVLALLTSVMMLASLTTHPRNY